MAKIQDLAVGTLKIKGNEITRITSRTSGQGSPISVPATFEMPVRFYVEGSNNTTVRRNRDSKTIGVVPAGQPSVIVDLDPEMSETYAILGGGTWTVRAVVRTR